ncbi:Lsr2 family protein [Streptomyces sp. TX20-6-3]|uniref:histone-like nucleoid-structuring protein Lsr2 n=1 Tax=Streptomyces sp. TX20-6-3 TaxID=3028705 RepID=UPI0029B9034C|nr:Lsr2 family protein [Streptomyces sp. TX20-6-3]MDX2565183.1 Lsr2 family protein [Streptomyces sp. TX20-6-3]
MAKRVIVESDLSGDPNAAPVHFSFDGTNYSVDLTEDEKESLGRSLAQYIDVAEEVTIGQQGISQQPSGPDPAKVRAWAQENGIEVNTKGRVPHSVITRYLRAQEEIAEG